MAQANQVDITKLRYVLYARKSTSDEGSQVRSLGDQIKDCEKLANSLGINVVAKFQESKSAKKPNRRPVFSQILKDIEAKKYDAILCWHPDRLCRNMLEGGQIINMLDESVLKDIRFHSHQFSNDANGKMLLGMLFVFSKQYSDDLSAKVSRGIDGNFDDGKSSGSPKWGYDRSDIDGIYRPNEFFDVMQQAWRQRSQGKTNSSILEFLLESGYHRMTKLTKKNKKVKKIIPTEKSLGVAFRDPFYYGLLVQADQTTDLREIYKFEAMIDESLFNEVQALAYTRKRDINPKKLVEFKPLMHMVFCGVCNNPRWMMTGKNKPGGSKHHVLSYRCDNKACERTVRSIRAFNVFNGIYSLLDNLELTDEAYGRYSKRIDSFTDTKIISIKQDIRSKRGAKAHKNKELEELSLSLGTINKKSPAYAINEARIAQLALECSELEVSIGILEDKISNPSKIKLTKEQFLNLIKSAPDKMRAGSAVEKDRLARILFLNLRIDNEKALSVIWREPFASLVKAIELPYGTRERT